MSEPGPPSTELTRSDVATISVSFFVAGVSTSIVLSTFGVEPLAVALAGAIMFSATGELALAGVLASGGALVTGLVSALLVSGRFALLTVALSTRFVGRPRHERALAAYIAVDPSVVMALKERTPAASRRAYWRVSAGITAAWICGSLLGVLVGPLVADPRAWGMDVAFPALLLAIMGTAMRASRTAAMTAVVAAVIAVVLAPLVPAGVPVLCAVVAALVGLRGPNAAGQGT